MTKKTAKILNGRDIYLLAEKYNKPILKHIFNKDTFYSYNEFKQYLLNNVDPLQYGGKETAVKKIIKKLFISFFNTYKTDKQNLDILLPDKLSDPQI